MVPPGSHPGGECPPWRATSCFCSASKMRTSGRSARIPSKPTISPFPNPLWGEEGTISETRFRSECPGHPGTMRNHRFRLSQTVSSVPPSSPPGRRQRRHRNGVELSSRRRLDAWRSERSPARSANHRRGRRTNAWPFFARCTGARGSWCCWRPLRRFDPRHDEHVHRLQRRFTPRAAGEHRRVRRSCAPRDSPVQESHRGIVTWSNPLSCGALPGSFPRASPIVSRAWRGGARVPGARRRPLRHSRPGGPPPELFPPRSRS